MPTLHVSDSVEQKRPLFLVSGSLKYITRSFISSLTEGFKLIVLNNPHKYSANENFFQVYNTAIGTIKNLSDPVDYAVFFINSVEDKKIFEQLLPKLEKDKPRTIIVFSVSHFSEFSDVILTAKSITSISFAIVGDIFGSEIPPTVSRVSRMVHTAITIKQAEFIGNELVSVYPISKSDVLKGIPYLLFSKEKQERVFFFFYEHPQTIISTIHLLKRIEPDLQIIYDSQPNEFTSLMSHKELEQNIKSKTHITITYLEEIFDGFEKSVREVSYSKVAKPARKKSRRSIKSLSPSKSSTQTFVTVLTCALLLFLVSNVLLTLSGVIFAKQAVASLKKGQFQQAGHQLSIAQKSFNLSKPVITLGFQVLQKFPFPEATHSYQLFTSGVNLTSLAAEQLAKINTVKTGVSQDDLLESIATLSYLYFASQSSPTYARLPHIDKLTEKTTSDVLATFNVLPEILGYKSEKRYLLLFQNNGELRPTGGFIGSVGDLRIKNGKVEEFIIQDVYDIDGQIKTHTEPPFIVRRYLQPHLYLRDSNFAIDFQESATTAAQLYKNGGGETVDGVIGIDYEVLKKVIELTGPLYLPTYNKTIDDKTGFEFIQSTIEDTFTPGGSQKKSILSEVFSQLVLKMENPQYLFTIAQNIPSLIEQKHILFAFKDPVVQEIFTTQSYAGSLNSSEASNKNTPTDYFAINEANIGANKANVFVTRNVALNQTLLEDSLSSQAIVTLDNTRGKEPYKVYLRFVTPSDNEFKELFINQKATPIVPAVTSPRLYEAASFTTPKDIELTEEIYQNKKVFGFVHIISPGKKDTLSVTYFRKIPLPDESFEYNFVYQPQPGTVHTPFTFSLSFPEEYTAQDTSTGTTAKRRFSFSHQGSQDISRIIYFEK